jgi:hypothetical protein
MHLAHHILTRLAVFARFAKSLASGDKLRSDFHLEPGLSSSTTTPVCA